MKVAFMMQNVVKCWCLSARVDWGWGWVSSIACTANKEKTSLDSVCFDKPYK